VPRLGHRPAVADGDEDAEGLHVAVDDAFHVGVLEGMAHRDEQLQPLPHRQLGLVAILGDL
jgi:hypothetical protein